MKLFDRLMGLASITFAIATSCAAQVQQTVPAQAAPIQGQPQMQSACGNQALCMDTPDFTATITDFRMSAANGFKLLDLTIRFQNKTNDTLILGYADGSEMAMDDQGNRYVPAPWGNAYRGIGLVAGNNMDPKFMMRPGSWGDARFELAWRPGAQDPIGSAFEYMLSIREINTLTGGQHSLGGEFPLRFSGLTNGVAGVSPATAGASAGGAGYVAGAAGGAPMMAGGQPCGTGAAGTLSAVAGAANGTGSAAASNAASQATNAASTLSSLGSLFKRKQNANNAANTVAGQPCVAGAPGTAAVPVNQTVAPVQVNPAVNAANPAVVNATAPAAGRAATITPAVARTGTNVNAPVTTVVTAPGAGKTPAPGTTAMKAGGAPTAATANPNAAAATQPAAARRAGAPVPTKPATTSTQTTKTPTATPAGKTTTAAKPAPTKKPDPNTPQK